MKSHTTSCCHEGNHKDKKKIDFLLWGTFSFIFISYFLELFLPEGVTSEVKINLVISSVYELVNIMIWGVSIGIVFIGLLGKVPREMVIAILGNDNGIGGIFRATFGGVLLDLCSHGILMVAAKLYERGASLGQVMAFLIASPWNSISLTLILWSLVGFKWMILFLIFSMIIACISGLIFEALVVRGILPANPNRIDLPKDFKFMQELKSNLASAKISPSLVAEILWQGLLDARMVLRWVFLGIILAALIRSFVSPDDFQTYFGATLLGLGMTLIVATILEVCSEGTLPVAADILTRAGAPGNSFAFLMAGVSTDYTEIMVLKDVTRSWKIALFLPLVTLPQIIVIALLLNMP